MPLARKIFIRDDGRVGIGQIGEELKINVHPVIVLGKIRTLHPALAGLTSPKDAAEAELGASQCLLYR